ncbi:DNA-invertase [Candidatus Phaeomarinobacter ectocarpi]|uniref:DNA-invertase n=1 Tax=Candidatus Phaeomarinibacter ectocarpi TaxID=1458461 RepID=X5MDA5_9HYPH|nr:recombinase family protein [Candidatus Phaeomarinobacter ectocarpi]CDO60027.1 DNA-invertase [Candidatus Phaeomarinobacter ectocarpi]
MNMDTIWPPMRHSGKRVGYARVSTQDQKLRMQLDGLNAVKCDLIFSDHGVSGKTDTRPGLDDALAALEPGDVLVVFKLDRLGRSVLHLADLLARFEREGIHFCSLAEGINTTSSGGRLVYHLFSAFAEFQREIIVENTMAGLQAAKARGSRLGRPPKLSPRDVMWAHECVYQRGGSLAEIARRRGISPITYRRAFERMGVDEAA